MVAPQPPRTLVLRAPNWVGDVVMATPLLAAAVADPRFERVSIVVRAHLAPLLSGGPCEPHVVALPRGADEVAALRALRSKRSKFGRAKATLRRVSRSWTSAERSA
jgi:hypothetical protein